jgi:uncharacterized repeat protein (TIGR03833 family)
MARDITKRDHLRPGLKVKVVPEDKLESNIIIEGIVAQVLSEKDDPRGVLVKLENGAVGHVLRIWEGGDARRDAPPAPKRDDALQSYNVEPKPPRPHRAFMMDDREVEKQARAQLGATPGHDLGKMMQKREEGLALKKFAIDDDELARQMREALGDMDDAKFHAKLESAPREAAEERADADDRARDEEDE